MQENLPERQMPGTFRKVFNYFNFAPRPPDICQLLISISKRPKSKQMKNLCCLLLLGFAIACQTPPPQSADKDKAPMQAPPVNQYFEEINVVKMHLFAISDSLPDAGNYPYTGKALPPEAFEHLEKNLRPDDGQQVFGCYRTENSDHYILRLSHQKDVAKLVLAKWEETTGQLTKIMDLAYIRCDVNVCWQQDAWLADLDDSRTLELIVRKHTRDASGAVSDESFEVLTDDGTGHFIKTNEQLASLAVKENYVMHQRVSNK